jgi:tetratricopeptide (TPR) repeat protein
LIDNKGFKKAEAVYNMGHEAIQNGNFDAAADFFRQADESLPDRPSILNGWAAAYMLSEKFLEAEAILLRLLSIEKNDFMARSNYATCLWERGSLTQALEAIEMAIDEQPGYANAWCTKGFILEDLQCWDQAVVSYERAIGLEKNFFQARQNLALLNLRLGRWNFGTLGYEWRHANPAYNEAPYGLSRDLWDFKRPLILWAEQGIGDQILHLSTLVPLLQFVRVPVYVGCARKLIPLVQQSFSEVTVFPKDDPVRLPEDSWHLALGSLQHFLWAYFQREPSPSPIAFLRTGHPCRTETKSDTDNQRLRIGFSWHSANKKVGEPKSAQPEDFLLSVSGGVEWVNLQYGTHAADRNRLASLGVVVDWADNVDKFDDLGALRGLIATCDLVISVSNTTVHLSGAMGIKTYVVVPRGHGRLWYWGKEGGECPWYSSLKIVDKDTHESWKGVIARVLDPLLSKRKGGYSR